MAAARTAEHKGDCTDKRKRPRCANGTNALDTREENDGSFENNASGAGASGTKERNETSASGREAKAKASGQ